MFKIDDYQIGVTNYVSDQCLSLEYPTITEPWVSVSASHDTDKTLAIFL